MKKVKRWRYYCDYCKKSGGNGGHMKKHELSCTANPDRKCGFCYQAEVEQPKTQDMIDLVNKFVTSVSWGNSDECSNTLKDGVTEKQVLKELRELTNNCPACILTAMRLTTTTGLFLTKSFDFQKEKKVFWLDHPREYPDHYGY